jgi:hypothetical protein
MWAWLLRLFQPELILKVQAETVKACGFLPAITTVSALIGVGPQAASALAIAASICSALKQPTMSSLYSGGRAPTVAGIPIEGEWIK